MRTMLMALISVSTFLFSTIVHAEGYGAKICGQDEFVCYKVKRGDTWKKLFPNDDERETVMRINRMNIQIYKGMTIAVPKDQVHDLLSYAPFPTEIDPPGERTIIVSTTKLAFGAYDSNGTLVHWGPISSGRNYCPDVGRGCKTTKGSFSIVEKRGQGCASTRYPVGRGGAPMPYCMFFNKNYALHGSYDVPGYNASHGCVRLFIDDAQWLNQDFTEGDGRTRVIIQ